MSLKINCPSCGQSLKIKESLAGKTVPCPACKTPFTIPIEPQSSGPASLEPAGNSQAEPASKPSQVRSQIGRFQIRAALGQGGFGTVYRAYDPILDREVALKVPRFDRRAAERLIVEARTAAPLRHPNIVAVYEAGADGDDLFIAAEYVKGQTLADRISAGNFDSQLAAAWVQSLADGLHYAHTESVIHRDVKPQNIMLGAQDRPQLMDFGLAVSDSTKAEASSDSQEVAGTPAYMSPEQARGENQAISAWSDQYSLGAVLYELLTGSPPFRGGNDVVEKIGAGEQPPAIRSVNKAVPRDLEAICRKAMAPRPEKRYSSCKALSEDLGRFLNGELVRARWYSPIELAVYWAKKRPALFGWTAAAVCLLALLLGGGIAWTINAMGKEAPAVVAETPVVPEVVPETPDEPEDIRSTRFDVTSTVEAETILYGRLLDRTREAFGANDVTLADRLLEESRWDFRGWEYNYLRRIVTGGWKTLGGHSGQITALAVHPDGGQCVSAGFDGTLRVWNLTTGEPVHTLSCSHRVTSLCYSPDGNLLALATGTDSGRSVIDAFDEKLSGEASRFGGPATAQLQFAPDAHPVILLNALTLDRVAVYTEHRGPIACVSFSADGRQIVSGGSEMPEGAQPGQPLSGSARLWNIETLKTERELASPSGPIHRIAFAADPQKIVGTTGGTYGGSVVVWNLASLAEPSTVNPLPPVAVPVPAAAPATQEFSAAQALPAAEVLPVAEAATVAAEAVPPAAVAPVAEAAPAPVAPVPADQQAAPAAPVVPVVAALQPLMPEQQLSSAEFALAMNPSMPGQLLSSPEIGLWLLAQNRRRVRGDFETLHEWNPASYETPRELHSELLATFDAAFAPDKNDYWLHSLATAGGDPLQIYRPGALMLRNPSYQRNGLVAHRGHRAALTAVAFRPDGKQFVTGDVTGALKVWNAEVHPEAITLPSQPAATRVAFGKDGRYVAVAGRSHSWETRRGAITQFDFQNRPLPPDPATPGTIQIHDITNGRQLLTLTGGPGDILGMAMDPQSRFIAAGGADQHVRVWNLDNGAVVHEWPTPGVVKYVAVSSDGRQIAACCQAAAIPAAPAPQPANQANGPANPEGFVLIYDAGNGQEIARWAAHRGDALSVAFSSDGQQIASSGADGEVKVWNLENQQLINTMESIDGQIVDLAFRPGSNELAGVGFNPCCNDKPGEVAVWNTTDGRRRLSVTRRTGRHYGITFSPDGQRFATCGGAYEGSLATPGDVAVWDSETGIELLPLAGPSGRLRTIQPETYTVMVNMSRTVSVPETKTVEKLVSVPKKVEYEVPVTKTGDDGKTVTVVEKRTKTVMETQARTEQITVMVQKEETFCQAEERSRNVAIMEETPGTVLSVAFSRDGRSLAAACEDGSAMVWDAENCDPEFTYRWPNGRMLCTATSPDGSLIATAGDSGNACKPQGLVRLVDAQTGRLARELTTPTGSITKIGFLPDGEQVVIATDVSEWNLPNPERTEPPLPAALKTPAQIAALREQQTEKAGCEIWNLVTGERVREIDGIQQRIDDLQIHPVNGNMVLASGQVVRMLDSTTGDEVQRWEVNQPVESLAFSSDGTSFSVNTSTGKLFRGRFDQDSPLTAVSEQISNPELVFDSVGERLFAVETASANPETPADTIVAPQECLVTLKRTTPAGHQMHIFGSDPSQPAAVFPLEFASAIQRLEFNGEQNALTVFGNDDQILVDADTGEVRPSPRPESEDASAVVPKLGPLASIRHERKLIVEQPNHIGADPDQCAACEPPRIRTVTLSSDPRYRLHEAQFSRDGKVAMLSAIHEIPIPFRNFRFHLQRNDTNTGKRLILGGHNLPIRSLAVRPGSDQIASAGDEQLFSVWDGKGDRIQVIQQAGKVTLLKYSPDGTMLLSAAEGIGEVAIWDADTLQEIRRIAAEPSTVFAAAIDPSGEQVVTGGASGVVKVWNAETGELIREWPAHEGRISTLQISHNGQMIATGGEDTIVTLWKWETGEVLHRTDKVDAAIGDVAFNADDSILAIGGATPKVRLLKTETGRFLSPLEDHPAPITSVQFSHDGTQLACCGPDAPLVIWDWKEGERLSTVPTAGTCVSWLSEGGHTVSATVNNAPAPAQEYEAVFTVNDVASGAIVEQFQIPDVSNGVFDLSPDGRFVVVARPDGVVLLWDRDSDTVVAECSGHQGVVRGLAFHPDGQQFVTTGEDATVRLWSIAGKELEVFKQPSGCSCIAFSPDGELIAVGMQRTVALWSLARKKLVRTFDGNYGELWNIEFDPTGASLAATSHILFDNKWVSDLKIWNVQTGDRLLSTRFKVNYGPQFSFHPTMPYVAVVGSNHQLLVLNSESGKQMLRVPSRATTQFVQYSPDGTKLLAWIDGLPKIVDATPEEIPFGTATVQPREQVAAESEAARWVLKQGGQIQVLIDHVAPLDVNRAEDLPTEPYSVCRVILSGNDKIDDKDLEILQPLRHLISVRLELPKVTNAGIGFLRENKNLQEVFLSGTRISDKGLEVLSKLDRLRVLVANGTQITGTGLSLYLGGCRTLETLDVYHCNIDDSSMPTILKFPSLRYLGLTGTKVSSAVVDEARRTHPAIGITF